MPGVVPVGREHKKRETRRRIQRAAWDLFVERGFAATTVQDISAAAGVVERTFFRYFPNKEAVLFHDGDHEARAFAHAFQARPADEPVWIALREALADMAAGVGARREQLLVRHQIAMSLSDRTDATNRATLRYGQVLAGLIAARMGMPHDDTGPALLAYTALAVAEIAYMDWIEGEASADLAEGFRNAFDVLARAANEPKV
jgi:AcrR family transcriptional regulator